MRAMSLALDAKASSGEGFCRARMLGMVPGKLPGPALDRNFAIVTFWTVLVAPTAGRRTPWRQIPPGRDL
jgi:hypothetical protein